MMTLRGMAQMGALAAGFAASVGQILVLRESFVLFHGYELSTGVVLACWLLWSGLGSWVGARLPSRAAMSPAAFVGAFLLLALALPGAVLWVRAGRLVWSLPPGELAGLRTMLGASVSAAALPGFLSGLVFSMLWRLRAVDRQPGEEASSMGIYAFEALGAALGGLVFHFLLLPEVSMFTAAMLTACVPAATALMFARRGPRSWKGFCFGEMVGLIIVLALGGMLNRSDFDAASRRWQWGSAFLHAVETPWQNLAVLKTRDQVSLFGNGLWLTSIPDRQTEEISVHPTLLEHPAPESVLVVGGSPHLVREIRKHPSVTRIDQILSDEVVASLLGIFGPRERADGSESIRVTRLYGDPRRLMEESGDLYDLILLNVGEPFNVALNRFFTVEFYQTARRMLRPGGIVSIALPGPLDMPGVVEARFLAVLDHTLRSLFPAVVVLPGEMARILAGVEDGALTIDAEVLARRLRERKLAPDHVREEWITDQMNPMRRSHLDAVLGRVKTESVNRDFDPVAFRHVMRLWAAQVMAPTADGAGASGSEDEGSSAGNAGGWDGWFWKAVALAVVVGGIPLLRPGTRLKRALRLNVAVAGGALMACEVGLLFVFQVLAGFLYAELAVIVAAFMTGAAAGALVGTVGKTRGAVGSVRENTARLAVVQGLLFIFFAILPVAFRVLHGSWGGGFAGGLHGVFFAVLAGVAGAFGGLHFSLANRVLGGLSGGSAGGGDAESRCAGEMLGGILYGWDLAGAALGALATSVVLIPTFGLEATFGFFGLFLACGAVTLLTAERLDARRNDRFEGDGRPES